MGTALERGQGLKTASMGRPDNQERQAILTESTDALVWTGASCILQCNASISQENVRPLAARLLQTAS